MKIIDVFDNRYNNLPMLFSRLNSDNYRIGSGRYILMVIPKELCLTPIDRWTGRGNHLVFNDNTDLVVNNNSYSRLLLEGTGLSIQEYFDLVVLHINDTDDRPRCMYCNKYLPFDDRLNHNYGLFCNESHSELFMQSHPEYSPKTFNHKINDYATYESRVKAVYSRGLSYGSPNDIVNFYLAESNGGYKYGMAKNINDRISYSRLDGYNYTNTKILFKSTRKEVLDIELKLKLIFRSEWIDKSLLNTFYKELSKLHPINVAD